MRNRWIFCSAVALTGVSVATFQAPTLAQLKPNAVSCPKGPLESDDQWIRRCAEEEEQQYKDDAARRSRSMNQQIGATARQRAALEKQPPLPAARNRLLGRWQSSTRPGGGGGDPFAQIAAMMTGCGVLIGDGILEFQPARMTMIDGDGRNDMGAVEYRGGANGSVFVLPARGSIFELLPFEFETPDRIHLIGVTCTLVRTNATAPASTGRAATPATPSSGRAGGAKPAPAAAAPAPAATAARPPAATRTGLKMISDRIGYHCPDGQQLAVDRCFNDAPDADCQVIRVDQPLRNGLEVTFIDTRGALTKRVAGCTQHALVVENRVLKLVR